MVLVLKNTCIHDVHSMSLYEDIAALSGLHVREVLEDQIPSKEKERNTSIDQCRVNNVSKSECWDPLLSTEDDAICVKCYCSPFLLATSLLILPHLPYEMH